LLHSLAAFDRNRKRLLRAPIFVRCDWDGVSSLTACQWSHPSILLNPVVRFNIFLTFIIIIIISFCAVSWAPEIYWIQHITDLFGNWINNWPKSINKNSWLFKKKLWTYTLTIEYNMNRLIYVYILYSGRESGEEGVHSPMIGSFHLFSAFYAFLRNFNANSSLHHPI